MVTDRKKHSMALFAGTGPSVARIDERTARLIRKSFDVWGSNQLFLHHYLGTLNVRVAPVSRHANARAHVRAV